MVYRLYTLTGSSGATPSTAGDDGDGQAGEPVPSVQSLGFVQSASGVFTKDLNNTFGLKLLQFRILAGVENPSRFGPLNEAPRYYRLSRFASKFPRHVCISL
jgi:hypothetical protein